MAAPLSVKELKALLTSRGVDFSHCLEKSDLEAALAASSAAPVRPPSAEALARLSGAPLLVALRAALHSSEEEGRELTRRVRALQLQQWQRQTGWSGMARHLVEDVHPIFRRGFADILKASARKGAVDVRAFERANEQLRGHHHTEDEAWFPRLRSLHADLKAQVKLLESDHRALVALEAAVRGGSMEALQSFVSSLETHLDMEEMLTVPLLMAGTGGW